MVGFNILSAVLTFAAVCNSVLASDLIVKRTGPVRLPSCVDYTPFVYSGCFADNGSPRALLYKSNLDFDSMTVEKCVAFCKGNGYRYAGLEYYGECWCGATVSGPLIAEPSCKFGCTGNVTEACGGNKAISVYQDPTFKVVDWATIDNYMALGCYSEGSNGKTLRWKQGSVGGSGLTVEICLSTCKSGGYAFAGVEFGRECYCGVVLGNGTVPLPASDCDIRCTGNNNQFCGGRSKLNLYVDRDLESTEPCGYAPPVSSSSTTFGSTSTISSTSAIASSFSSSVGPSTSLTTSSSTAAVSSGSSASSSSSGPSGVLPTPYTTTSSTIQQSPSSSSSSSSSGSSGVLPTPYTTSPGTTQQSSSSISSEESSSSSASSFGSSSSVATTISQSSTPAVSSSSSFSSISSSKSISTSVLITTTSPSYTSSSSGLIYPSSGVLPTPFTTSSALVTTFLVTSSKSTSDAVRTTSSCDTTNSGSLLLSSGILPTAVTTTSRLTTISSSTLTSITSKSSTTTTSKTFISYTLPPVSSTTPRPSAISSTTTSVNVCTSIYTIYPPLPTPTCGYKLGNWCAKPIPEFNDTFTCLKSFTACVTQLGNCFRDAGYPDSLRCNEFNQYCSRIASFCGTFCPGPRCSVIECSQIVPPYGVPPPSPTFPVSAYTTTFPCTTSSLIQNLSSSPAATTSINPPTYTYPPTPDYPNMCTQPSSPTNDYGVTNPVGGYPLPILSCNNDHSDYNSGYPFKLYTSSDTKNCRSYVRSGQSGPVQGCVDACEEQYKLCVSGYANPYKGYKKFKRGERNDYYTALNRCIYQQNACFAVNRNVNGGLKCSSFNTGY